MMNNRPQPPAVQRGNSKPAIRGRPAIGVESFREEATRRLVFTSGCKRIFASLPLGAEEDKQTDSHPQYPAESTVLKAPREKQACQNVKEIQKALAQPIPNHAEPNSAEMRCFSKTISG